MSINTRHKTGRANKVSSSLARFYGLSGILKEIFVASLLINSVPAFCADIPAGQSVTLAWNPSPNPDVIGYNIYSGLVSRNYTNKIDVGDVTNSTISGLIAGVTYYFAATAYDNLGEESGLSDEINYLVPSGAPIVKIANPAADQFILTVSGHNGQTYEIQATPDLKTWTTIGNGTIGLGGSLDFTDMDTANFAQRFYRIHESP